MGKKAFYFLNIIFALQFCFSSIVQAQPFYFKEPGIAVVDLRFFMATDHQEFKRIIQTLALGKNIKNISFQNINNVKSYQLLNDFLPEFLTQNKVDQITVHFLTNFESHRMQLLDTLERYRHSAVLANRFSSPATLSPEEWEIFCSWTRDLSEIPNDRLGNVIRAFKYLNNKGQLKETLDLSGMEQESIDQWFIFAPYLLSQVRNIKGSKSSLELIVLLIQSLRATSGNTFKATLEETGTFSLYYSEEWKGNVLEVELEEKFSDMASYQHILSSFSNNENIIQVLSVFYYEDAMELVEMENVARAYKIGYTTMTHTAIISTEKAISAIQKYLTNPTGPLMLYIAKMGNFLLEKTADGHQIVEVELDQQLRQNEQLRRILRLFPRLERLFIKTDFFTIDSVVSCLRPDKINNIIELFINGKKIERHNLHEPQGTPPSSSSELRKAERAHPSARAMSRPLVSTEEVSLALYYNTTQLLRNQKPSGILSQINMERLRALLPPQKVEKGGSTF